jgi:predicted dehydrogenase
MRVGVVGVGRIGSFHAGVLAKHPALQQLHRPVRVEEVG